ncbi:MAG TPA: hypothetical protein VFZ23_01370 [Pyrinomonadaceae bacterium]
MQILTTIETTNTSLANAHRPLHPSFISFDEFIDVDRLRSLDAYLTRRIRRHIADNADDFFVNQHVLEAAAPYRPGVREIWLKRTLHGIPYDYLDINRTHLWQLTSEAAEFTLLMDFIHTLPFDSIGRVLLIYDEGGHSVPAHRDHKREDICHDFVWFRTNLRKPFYLLNHHTGVKVYVSGYSAWFDTVNQYHGSGAAEGLTFSIRVDGHFTREFRRKIPYAAENVAATPAKWASTEVQE